MIDPELCNHHNALSTLGRSECPDCGEYVHKPYRHQAIDDTYKWGEAVRFSDEKRAV